MNTKLILCVCAVLAIGSSNSSANEVVLTQGHEKSGGSRLALDFVNFSGEATGFEFELALPKGARNVDTSKCLSELPASHTGACQFNQKTGRVIVIVYSNENRPLPRDGISLGWIGGVPSAGAGVRVEKLLVADVQGRSLPVTATAQSERPEMGAGRPPENDTRR